MSHPYMFPRSATGLAISTMCAVLLAAHGAFAAVSSDQASRLGGSLTPLGGETEGNDAGTIPAWDGGYTTPLPGYVEGGRRGMDPFPGERPLFTIDSTNADQYKEQLSEGTIAMMGKYPSLYRVNVYPSHRTMAASRWVNDNTLANATRAKLVDNVVSDAFGGIPFPIPQSGEEVMWNHLMRVRPVSWHIDARAYLITSTGSKVLTTDSDIKFIMPYYDPARDVESFAASGGVYYAYTLISNGPPIRAGEGVAQHVNVNSDKTDAWVYLTGQRRVRKLPNACCDTPFPASSGVASFDELYVFDGRLDRFKWTIIGKKEYYIPYNSNISVGPKNDNEFVLDHILNPEYIRWELHRVWVLEANLVDGQRHVSPRSRYYLDEDSWTAVLADRYSADGKLAKTMLNIPIVAPDVPALLNMTFGFYDLVSGAGWMAGIYNYSNHQYVPTKYMMDEFSPEALAAGGIR